MIFLQLGFEQNLKIKGSKLGKLPCHYQSSTYIDCGLDTHKYLPTEHHPFFLWNLVEVQGCQKETYMQPCLPAAGENTIYFMILASYSAKLFVRFLRKSWQKYPNIQTIKQPTLKPRENPGGFLLLDYSCFWSWKQLYIVFVSFLDGVLFLYRLIPTVICEIMTQQLKL